MYKFYIYYCYLYYHYYSDILLPIASKYGKACHSQNRTHQAISLTVSLIAMV